MLKSAAVVAVPGVLGGLGFFYGPSDLPRPHNPFEAGYVVEVGVAFDPSAVRAALPDGLVPDPDSTGGIAFYGGQKGWALSPLATGFVWIDLASDGDDAPGRFLLHGFTAEQPEQALYLFDEPVAGDQPQPEEATLLRAAAWPGGAALFDVLVRPDWDRCSDGLSAKAGNLIASAEGGDVRVIHMPVVIDLCEAEPVSATIDAPAEHVLGSLAPLRVLWAGVATPLRWTMPDLPES